MSAASSTPTIGLGTDPDRSGPRAVLDPQVSAVIASVDGLVRLGERLLDSRDNADAKAVKDADLGRIRATSIVAVLVAMCSAGMWVFHMVEGNAELDRRLDRIELSVRLIAQKIDPDLERVIRDSE